MLQRNTASGPTWSPRGALSYREIKTVIRGNAFHARVALFGGGVTNLSLKPFAHSDDPEKNPARTTAVRSAILEVGVGDYYAPDPTAFNGKVVCLHDLTNRISLGQDVNLWRGKEADAVVMSRGKGFALSTGGCPLVLATNGKRMIPIHAGFRSIFRPDEPHRSVINNALDLLEGPRGDIRVWMFYSIRPEAHLYPLSDPTHAKKNAQMHAALKAAGHEQAILPSGGIDLPAIIRQQVSAAGVIPPARDRDVFLPPGAFHTRMPGIERENRNLAVVYFDGIH